MRSPGSDLSALALRARQGGITVAGVLSGTSADGVDVGLVRFCAAGPEGAPLAPPELLAFETRPFPGELQARLRAVLDARRGSAGEARLGLGTLARLDLDLGRCFGEAAAGAAERAGLPIDLVGSHGQTVWHHDGLTPGAPATLQLGNLAAVAEAAGVPASGDFRQADVAAGGEGAPLSALVDPYLFATAPRPAAILNLGGIGNLTWLGAAGELSAFDTGPAGSLLDGLARAVADLPFDRGGALAAAGKVHEPTVAALLEHPFFHRPPPRSTGRDTFGASFVEAFLERAQGAGLRRPEDLLATATACVAGSIALAVDEHLPSRPRQLIVAGGGLHNHALMAALKRQLAAPATAAQSSAPQAIPVISSAEYGVNPDAREALVFAFLAGACLSGVPLSEPRISGARAGRILGLIAPGPVPGAPPGDPSAPARPRARE